VQLDFTEKATTATAWWHTTDKLIPVYCFQPKHFPSRLLTNLVKPVTQKSWLYSTKKKVWMSTKHRSSTVGKLN